MPLTPKSHIIPGKVAAVQRKNSGSFARCLREGELGSERSIKRLNTTASKTAGSAPSRGRSWSMILWRGSGGMGGKDSRADTSENLFLWTHQVLDGVLI